MQILTILNAIWGFLNQQLISEAIGALLFGLAASIAFKKYSDKKQEKELEEEAKILVQWQKEILQKVILHDFKGIISILKSTPLHMFPKMTGELYPAKKVETLFLLNKAFKVKEPELFRQTDELYDEFIEANNIYDKLRELSLIEMPRQSETAIINARASLVSQFEEKVKLIEEKIKKVLQ